MVVCRRELDRERVHGRYYVVSGYLGEDAPPAFRRSGRVYVRHDATGGDPVLQDVAAFEAMLEKDTPKYYAQLEALRLAAKLGALKRYFHIAEKQPYSRSLLKLVQLEAGE